MFFTTEITVPFETRRDALMAFPEWKTMVRKGNQRNFKELAEEGIPIYVEFWKRLETVPEEVIYGGIKEGMELIANDQIIIHISGKALNQYFKNNPTGQTPKTFKSEGENLAENLVLTENSPLVPYLRYGCWFLYESGIMDVLDTKWMGKEVKESRGGSTVVFALAPGQVMMSFALFATAAGLSILVLCLESVVKMSSKSSILDDRDEFTNRI